VRSEGPPIDPGRKPCKTGRRQATHYHLHNPPKQTMSVKRGRLAVFRKSGHYRLIQQNDRDKVPQRGSPKVGTVRVHKYGLSFRA
jgi:hypothetical protein